MTTTTPPPVFTVDPDLTAAYASRCIITGITSEVYRNDVVELSRDWDPRRPDSELDHLPLLITEAQECGALTAAIPGCEIRLELDENGNGAWYLWRYILPLPGCHLAVSSPEWTRTLEIGADNATGEAAVAGIVSEAVTEGNRLLAGTLTALTAPVPFIIRTNLRGTTAVVDRPARDTDNPAEVITDQLGNTWHTV